MSQIKHFSVVFNNQEYRRASESDYAYASYKPFSGNFSSCGVAFHKSYAAARRRAGAFGAIKPVEKVR